MTSVPYLYFNWSHWILHDFFNVKSWWNPACSPFSNLPFATNHSFFILGIPRLVPRTTWIGFSLSRIEISPSVSPWAQMWNDNLELGKQTPSLTIQPTPYGAWSFTLFFLLFRTSYIVLQNHNTMPSLVKTMIFLRMKTGSNQSTDRNRRIYSRINSMWNETLQLLSTCKHTSSSG